jgi:hypothetical protein
MSEEKLKVLLVSIAPPHNDCGGRIINSVTGCRTITTDNELPAGVYSKIAPHLSGLDYERVAI